jgi:hypothetical protein
MPISDEEFAVESPLWRLARPLAVGQVVAFAAACTLGLLHHTTAAAITLGAANVAGILWVAALFAASSRLRRRGDER